MSRKKKENSQPAAADAPNIQYVGKRQKFHKEKLKMMPVAKEVPAFITDGKTKIILPEGIENGIYMPPETVARLFALRPDDFKTPVLKSAKKAAQPADEQKQESESEVTR